MQQRLNAEGHDESQYLPKIFNPVSGKMEQLPPVNAYRAAKGDIIRNDDDKLQAMKWLPDILHRRDKLKRQHLDTCNSFFRLLVHAKRTLGICDLRGQLFDKFPAGISDNTDVFLEILRTIPKPESNILVWLVWDDYNHGNVELALHVIGTILHGLENAQGVIDICAKKRDNAISTSPEPRPNLACSGTL